MYDGSSNLVFIFQPITDFIVSSWIDELYFVIGREMSRKLDFFVKKADVVLLIMQ